MANAIVIQNGVRITNGVIIRNGNGTPMPTIYYVVTEDLLENIQTEDGDDVITENSQSGGTAGIDGSVGYTEINGPVIPSNQLEDSTATVNDPIGFTINDSTSTGVAMANLSASNQAFFASFTAPGTYTVTWGPGSTVASSQVFLAQNNGSTIVFFIQGQTGAATYNYPFTFS